MVDQRKKVKQHLASLRTSINNVEGRLIDLLATYAPDEQDPQNFFKLIFSDMDKPNYAGRTKYVTLLALMYYYNDELRKVLDEYDIIV